MLKKFFIPARLVEAKGRWYIEYYQTQPDTGECPRTRLYGGLNRIKDLKERRKVALAMVRELNKEKLPFGWPYQEPVQDDDITTIADAIKLALDAKRALPRKKSFQTLESKVRPLSQYLKEKKWEEKPIKWFTRSKARAFMTWLDEKKNLTGITYNNYVKDLRSVFGEMIKDNLIDENPWSMMPKRQVEDKKRRTFTQKERLEVAAYVRKVDPWLFCAILMQYYCFVRPSEMRRLKFKDLDLHNGVINLPKDKTKNARPRTVTIPKKALDFFMEMDFPSYPVNYFIFGNNMQPHLSKAVGSGTMYRLHQKYLRELMKNGKLNDISGLQFYSWKDTGITDMSQVLDPYRLKDQTGHVKFEVLLRYYHKQERDARVWGMDVDMI